jgi:hypothetical protein
VSTKAGELQFSVRHYLNLGSCALAVIVAAVWHEWWIAAIFAACAGWSILKLRQSPTQ